MHIFPLRKIRNKDLKFDPKVIIILFKVTF